MKNDLTCLFEATPKNARSILWMSHTGPATCGTTLINRTPHFVSRKNNVINAGSEAVREHLDRLHEQTPKDASTPVFCLLHGHSHFAWGHAKYGDVSIINPGALRDGRLALLEFGITSADLWELTSIQYCTLK
jgi:Icc-related predicted phosphoesterase